MISVVVSHQESLAEKGLTVSVRMGEYKSARGLATSACIRLRSRRNCWMLFFQAASLGGASSSGQYPSGHAGRNVLGIDAELNDVPLAIRRCSSKCQAEKGRLGGFTPRNPAEVRDGFLKADVGFDVASSLTR